jgi:hypothetical protein
MRGCSPTAPPVGRCRAITTLAVALAEREEHAARAISESMTCAWHSNATGNKGYIPPSLADFTGISCRTYPAIFGGKLFLRHTYFSCFRISEW